MRTVSIFLILAVMSGCGSGALGVRPPKMPMQCNLMGTEGELYIYSCQGGQGVDNIVYVDADGDVQRTEFVRAGGR